jgi:hypothetical protein
MQTETHGKKQVECQPLQHGTFDNDTTVSTALNTSSEFECFAILFRCAVLPRLITTEAFFKTPATLLVA